MIDLELFGDSVDIFFSNKYTKRVSKLAAKTLRELAKILSLEKNLYIVGNFFVSNLNIVDFHNKISKAKYIEARYFHIAFYVCSQLR